MWVEVISRQDRIVGLLKNQPRNVPDLNAGTQVTVEEGDIFDTIHRRPDGTSEENEPGALIQQYGQ
jgi:uncharacterized protein YegJ (DUF2314 family)